MPGIVSIENSQTIPFTPFAIGSSHIISSSHEAVEFSGINAQTGGVKSEIMIT
jgi:hypothetical protein